MYFACVPGFDVVCALAGARPPYEKAPYVNGSVNMLKI